MITHCVNAYQASLLCVCTIGVLTASPVARADRWDLGINSLSLGVADVGWTVGENYEGAKLLLDGRHTLQR